MNCAHRCPASSGMAGLLKRTELDDEQREYLDSINTSANVISGADRRHPRSVEDRCRQTAAQAGAFFARIVERDLLGIEQPGAGQGVELIAVYLDVPERVPGDERHFRQIPFNLIGNATTVHRGDICVHVRMQPADQDIATAHLQIPISDTVLVSPPIASTMCSESSGRQIPSSTRRYGGTGLGTAIARDLARLMGGSIGVLSEAGAWQPFWVKLPLLIDEAPDPPEPPKMLRGAHALVFEQNEAERRRDRLRCEGGYAGSGGQQHDQPGAHRRRAGW